MYVESLRWEYVEQIYDVQCTSYSVCEFIIFVYMVHMMHEGTFFCVFIVRCLFIVKDCFSYYKGDMRMDERMGYGDGDNQIHIHGHASRERTL